MHAECGVAEHRLGSRGAELHELIFQANYCVLERPEAALRRLRVRLVVGHRCLQLRVPVHEAFAAIDVAVAEHVEEGFAYRFRARVIEREARARPVARCPDLLQLAEDARLVLVLPLPDFRDECFAAEVVTCLLLGLHQQAFDHRLRGDPRVIGAGHPERVAALHPSPTHEDILQRDVQRVPHVQRTRHVRWRDHNRVRLAPLRRVRMEVSAFIPERQPLLLRFFRVVSLRQFDWHGRSSVRSMVWSLFLGIQTRFEFRKFAGEHFRSLPFRIRSLRFRIGSLFFRIGSLFLRIGSLFLRIGSLCF